MKDTARTMRTNALILAAFAAVGATLLGGVHGFTQERIAHNERATLIGRLNQVVPAARYDNDMLHDTLELPDARSLGSARAVTVYRARRNGRPVAAIFDVVAADGYSGDIRLLVGVNRDGSVAGVRVVSHRETPGLGDKIELQRSNWIRGFNGRSLVDPPAQRWRVRRDGGEFDQFTGATITPRAVVGAVRRVLAFAAAQGELIYAVEANQ